VEQLSVASNPVVVLVGVMDVEVPQDSDAEGLEHAGKRGERIPSHQVSPRRD
jgi:hypothetical protein